ncbi:hypothetical protein, partial [Bifidobacterium jacchi]
MSGRQQRSHAQGINKTPLSIGKALVARIVACVAAIATFGSVALVTAQPVYASESAASAAPTSIASQTSQTAESNLRNTDIDTALDTQSYLKPQTQPNGTDDNTATQTNAATRINQTDKAADKAVDDTGNEQNQASASAIQSLVTTVNANHPNAGGNESADNIKDRNPETKWYEGDGAAPSDSQP